MHEATSCVDKCEMVVNSYPDHVRKHVVEILKIGVVPKGIPATDNIVYYLEVGFMSPPLKSACEDVLLKHINAINCVDALEIASRFGLLSLVKTATEMVSENFHNLWHTESFTRLSENDLDTLCNIDKIARHKDIFRALQKWHGFNHEPRMSTYCRLLEVVQRRRTENPKQEIKRKCATYHAMLMLSASKSKTSVVTAVFNCDGEVVCHRSLFKSNDIKGDLSLACVQKDETDAPYVYIASGKYVFRYDPIVNKHESCENLVHNRSQGSLVSMGDSVYAIGGHHNNKNVLEIEELDTKTHKAKLFKKNGWKVIAKVPEHIKLHSAPCLASKDDIYIIGESMSLSENKPCLAVLVFSPIGRSIRVVAEFPKKCSDCTAILHDKNIYIASSEGYFLKLDIVSNIFSSCSDLIAKETNITMYSERNMIYTVGSSSSGQFERNCYDTETNSWKQIRNYNLNLPVHGLCDIKVPSYTNVVPFYDTEFKEIKR
ncbi:kelch repeat and BTB domain-containing protein 3-like [Mytilus californianus]|uniref:kelch repeat and BTB domain-containing protein 3-like n=1 Tax=Mytilus californianus TaxID=6549 RepID=UPI002246B7EF|nr:kelch repeat and BTB domain-containing protein 3-like [Mytilus californianus]